MFVFVALGLRFYYSRFSMMWDSGTFWRAKPKLHDRYWHVSHSKFLLRCGSIVPYVKAQYWIDKLWQILCCVGETETWWIYVSGSLRSIAFSLALPFWGSLMRYYRPRDLLALGGHFLGIVEKHRFKWPNLPTCCRLLSLGCFYPLDFYEQLGICQWSWLLWDSVIGCL